MRLVVIRILIVDDSAIFREGLRAMLEAHTDWEVCGEAMNGVEGVQKNRLLKPVWYRGGGRNIERVSEGPNFTINLVPDPPTHPGSPQSRN